MTVQDFVSTLERMRWYQRQYFATRDHYTLLDAKRYERLVDQLLLDLKLGRIKFEL